LYVDGPLVIINLKTASLNGIQVFEKSRKSSETEGSKSAAEVAANEPDTDRRSGVDLRSETSLHPEFHAAGRGALPAIPF
jgi:hypothetical protein